MFQQLRPAMLNAGPISEADAAGLTAGEAALLRERQHPRLRQTSAGPGAGI